MVGLGGCGLVAFLLLPIVVVCSVGAVLGWTGAVGTTAGGALTVLAEATTAVEPCGPDTVGPVRIPAPGGGLLTVTGLPLFDAGAIYRTVRQSSRVPVADRAAATIVALMAGLAESGLLNLPNRNVPETVGDIHFALGDGYSAANPPSNGTSLGVFQQQVGPDGSGVGFGWGTVSDEQSVTWQTEAFLGVTGRSGMAGGLLAVRDWPGQAYAVDDQAVQDSAFPGNYAPWQVGATVLYGSLAGLRCPSLADGAGRTAVRAALSQLGVPYVYGGGHASIPPVASGAAVAGNGCPVGGRLGPEEVCVTAADLGRPGWDCSGLVGYAFSRAGVDLLGTAAAQYATVGRRPGFTRSSGSLQPGDVVFWVSDGTVGAPGHVGLFLGPMAGRPGGPQVVDAPETGQVVQIQPFSALAGLRFDGGGPA